MAKFNNFKSYFTATFQPSSEYPHKSSPAEANQLRRAVNGVAHSLARFARNLREEVVWLEEDPPPALEALYVDSCSLSI